MKREYIYGLLLGAALLACLGAAVEMPFNANSSANVKGNLSITGTNFNNYLVSSNEISAPALAVGTFYLSNMVANTLGGFDSTKAFVPLSMTTNVLDLLYTQSSNLTNWGKLGTNSMAPLASPAFTGTPTLDGNPLLTNVTKLLVTNALSFSGNSGKLITAAATEIDVPTGGAGIVGTVINTGASTANAIPKYSGTDGTNVAPTAVSVGGVGDTNIVAGGHQFGTGGLVLHAGFNRTNSFSLEQPDSNTAGNQLGIGAVDLQIGRNGATKVASGNNAFAAGTNNLASQNYTAAFGSGNSVSAIGGFVAGTANVVEANYGTAFGANNYTSHNYATALGNYSQTTGQGEVAFASGTVGLKGDSQGMLKSIQAKMTTSTSTQTNLLQNSTTLNLPNNMTWVFDGLVVARSSGSATGETNACFFIEGGISRDANAASTVLLWSNVKTNYQHAAAAGWSVSVEPADTTNGALVIKATGDTCVTINWECVLRIAQVGG